MTASLQAATAARDALGPAPPRPKQRQLERPIRHPLFKNVTMAKASEVRGWVCGARADGGAWLGRCLQWLGTVFPNVVVCLKVTAD